MASKIRLKSSHKRYLLADDKRPRRKSRVEPEQVERVAASKTKKKRK